MKRIGCLFAFFLFVFSACACADSALRGYSKESSYQYILFGAFPQTSAESSGEPILWRVLSVSDDEAYLLSEYILFNNRIHPDDNAYKTSGGAFNQTEIYALLNGPFERIVISAEEEAKLREKTYYGYAYDAEMSFYDQAFTQAEKALILKDEQLGFIFLPSADDLENADYGFGSDKARKACGTEFAMSEGLFRYSNGSSPYWTRSESIDFAYGTRCTKEHGNVGYIRCVVMNEGIRPALCLNMQGLEWTGGDGTMENPYTLNR